MPQDSAAANRMFGFKGSHCAGPNYNRVRYKKWPWVSFLIATVCIGIIFFIAGSPANIHQMHGRALVLCSILLALGTLLLVPSTVVVFYLGVYFLMVYFKCSARRSCSRPIEWARRLNSDTPEDQILVSRDVRDENDNPTNSSKNKRKQDQSSGSRKKPEQLSVPSIVIDSNNINHLPPDKHKDKRMTTVGQPNAQTSVYSVQTDIHNSRQDNAYHQRKTNKPNYNHVHHNHDSGHRNRDRRGTSYDGPLPYRGRPDGEGGASNGVDNVSFDPNEDSDNSLRHQTYHPSPVHSYKHSAGSYPDSNRSINGPYEGKRTSKGVYGVSRAPNLDVGPRTANNLKKSQNPPSYPNPPIDAHVNVVHHPLNHHAGKMGPNSSPKSTRSNNVTDRQDRSRTKQPKSNSKTTAIEMDEYSIPKRKTLAEQAKDASKRPPPQVRGYRSTNKVSGYLETSMNNARAGSSMSDGRSDNFNNANNNYRSKPSKAH